MTREIKFRGHRLDDGEWIYGDLAHSGGETLIFPPEAMDSYDRYMVDPASIGQYAGLKDKNGTEIYEGDIIQHGYVAYQYLIEYITSGFQCCKRPGEICFSLFEADMHRVIGNIHDNSDLLTAE